MQAAARPIAAPARDIRFDSLRGLLLVSMAINHLPSDLRVVTDQGVGIVSSAEGFVFLSGVLAGFVYTRRLWREGASRLRAMTRHRAGVIYRWHLAAYFGAFAALAINAWITGVHSNTSPPLFTDKPLLASVLGPLLLYQPGLLDILPMYCVFVLLLPYVLGALEKGWRWPLLATSFGLWAVVQFLPNYDGSIIFPPLNLGFFNLLAWQFLFISGVTIGYAKTKSSTALTPVRPGLLLAAIGAAVFFYLLQHQKIPSLWSDQHFGIMLNKPSLGALRLMSSALCIYLVAVAGTRFPRLFSWRPLAILGRHSLPVVAAQCVLVLVFLAHDNFFTTATGRWIVSGATIASLFAVAGLCELLPRRPTVVSTEPSRTRELPVFAAAKVNEQARAA
ncbi:MAG TPA: OpgC domain-containing protein [Opitutaceae bacterium]|nr:OpgC domain-containing protein [Opitutaceae bacterium]